MVPTIRIDTPPLAPTDSDGLVVLDSDFPEPAVVQMWKLILLMAVRDRARSVHYHPWRGAGELAFVVESTRYELVPPPGSMAAEVVAFWRPVAAPGWRGAVARWLGRRSMAGPFRVELNGEQTEWHAAVWSSGSAEGVELHRVTPLPGDPPAGWPSPPPAPPDFG